MIIIGKNLLIYIILIFYRVVPNLNDQEIYSNKHLINVRQNMQNQSIFSMVN